jgi:hypothetical protein
VSEANEHAVLHQSPPVSKYLPRSPSKSLKSADTVGQVPYSHNRHQPHYLITVNEAFQTILEQIDADRFRLGPTPAQRRALRRLGRSEWYLSKVKTKEQASKIISAAIAEMSVLKSKPQPAA